jgi:alkylation response protein AidB-like acyl-CoA dehydrogenase
MTTALEAPTAVESLTRVRDLSAGIAGRAGAHDADGSFPTTDLSELRSAGLLGLMVPRRLGGSGAGFADYAEVAMALGAASGATALIFNMHASVTGALAHTDDDLARALGVPETFFPARDEILRGAAGGRHYAVAMSERGAGSRLSEMTTSYEPSADGWRIRGSKTFCTAAGHADAYLVGARRGESVSQFLVPAGPGLTVVPSWDVLGMRATGSHDLELDVVVPPEALLGQVEGMALLLAQVMPQWLVASYAAVYVGVAQAALDAGADYVTGRGLGALPMVRARLGRADAQVAAARAAVRTMAAAVSAAPGDPETNRWVWRAKLLAGDAAADVAASVLEACGTAATRRGSPLERLYRDARCGALQPATSDVCADWLGLAALGEDPHGQAQVPRW